MKSKQNFIEIMTALQMQYDSDFEYAKNVGESMGIELNPYNNSLLVNALLRELGSWFDDSEEVISEIKRFMYELDFNRQMGSNSFGMFWNSLTVPSNKHNINEFFELNAFPILDEAEDLGGKIHYHKTRKKDFDGTKPSTFLLDEIAFFPFINSHKPTCPNCKQPMKNITHE